MRLSLKELCGIEVKELMLLTHKEASEKIIDACYAEQIIIAKQIHDARSNPSTSYEHLSSIIIKYQYLDKAIEARISDYEESGFKYERNYIV